MHVLNENEVQEISGGYDYGRNVIIWCEGGTETPVALNAAGAWAIAAHYFFDMRSL